MQKQAWTWTTPLFPARLVRWGHFGAPVLIFPTAGGDYEEIERFQLVAALASLIDQGRFKVYCVDGLNVRARLSGTPNIDDAYDSYLCGDVLQRIRVDCQDPKIEPMLVGASLGAQTAVDALFRHPDAFRGVIAMSLRTTPVVPASAEKLKSRAITVATGAGNYEDPNASKRLVDALGAKSIPCRFINWGAERDHTWATWRDALPGLL